MELATRNMYYSLLLLVGISDFIVGKGTKKSSSDL
jgi:hypothetical protein